MCHGKTALARGRADLLLMPRRRPRGGGGWQLRTSSCLCVVVVYGVFETGEKIVLLQIEGPAAGRIERREYQDGGGYQEKRINIC